MRISKLACAYALLAVVLILVGCSGPRVMMPTPNVHLDPKRDYFADLGQGLKSTEVPLFYVTDRAPEKDQKGNLRYGYQRSASLGFGTAVVDLGAPWNRPALTSGRFPRVIRRWFHRSNPGHPARPPTQCACRVECKPIV